MVIIVGLGNPGKKYKNTRHNIGFRILDEFRKENKFPPFKISKKVNSLISEGKISGKKILLAKPQTFMNKSGNAVKTLINFYKITRTGLVIIHDDIDLPLGEIKIIKNRGSAGHKGVESIIRELKTKDFLRFRIGINQFAQNQKSKIKNQKSDEFVLKEFTKDEEKIIKEVIKTACQALKTALTESIEKAMSEFNKYG